MIDAQGHVLRALDEAAYAGLTVAELTARFGAANALSLSGALRALHEDGRVGVRWDRDLGQEVIFHPAYLHGRVRAMQRVHGVRRA